MKCCAAAMWGMRSAMPSVQPKRSRNRRSGAAMRASVCCAAIRIGIGPRVEPGVDEIRRAGVDAVGDQIAEERQLIAPALHVLVARAFVSEFVRQAEERAGACRRRGESSLSRRPAESACL